MASQDVHNQVNVHRPTADKRISLYVAGSLFNQQHTCTMRTKIVWICIKGTAQDTNIISNQKCNRSNTTSPPPLVVDSQNPNGLVHDDPVVHGMMSL